MAKRSSYRTRANREIAKVAKEIAVTRRKALSKEENETLMLVSAKVAADVKKAIGLYKEGKSDKADTIICNIPYHMAGLETGGEYPIRGTDAAYRRFDGIRHLIRMADLEGGGQIGGLAIWNNVMLVG